MLKKSQKLGSYIVQFSTALSIVSSYIQHAVSSTPKGMANLLVQRSNEGEASTASQCKMDFLNVMLFETG